MKAEEDTPPNVSQGGTKQPSSPYMSPRKTPKKPSQKQTVTRAWRSICLAHLCRCLADRSWSFFLPLFLSKSCQSIKSTSVLKFAQQLSVALGSAPCAGMYRRLLVTNAVPLPSLIVSMTIIENSAVAVGGFLICIVATITSFDHNDAATGMESIEQTERALFCDAPLQSWPFLAGLFCMAIDAVFSLLLKMIVSKEWVAVLFPHDEDELAHANATLARIDLAIAALVPLVISYLMQHVGYDAVAMMLVGQHLVGAALIIYNLQQAWTQCPSLLHQQDSLRTQEEQSNEGREETVIAERKTPSAMGTITSLTTQSQLVIAAYILLYFTVISPGAMLNAWMNSLALSTTSASKSATAASTSSSAGLNEMVIAIFGASSNITGALATFLTPNIIIPNSSTLHQAGFLAQSTQTLCVLAAYACFVWINGTATVRTPTAVMATVEHDETPTVSPTYLYAFLVFVGFSRIGLWSFDLIERQVLQQDIPITSQTVIFNLENSATQLISMAMTYLCYVFADQFDVLVTISTCAVTLSCVLLGIAQHRQRKRQSGEKSGTREYAETGAKLKAQ